MTPKPSRTAPPAATPSTSTKSMNITRHRFKTFINHHLIPTLDRLYPATLSNDPSAQLWQLWKQQGFTETATWHDLTHIADPSQSPAPQQSAQTVINHFITAFPVLLDQFTFTFLDDDTTVKFEHLDEPGSASSIETSGQRTEKGKGTMEKDNTSPKTYAETLTAKGKTLDIDVMTTPVSTNPVVGTSVSMEDNNATDGITAGIWQSVGKTLRSKHVSPSDTQQDGTAHAMSNDNTNPFSALSTYEPNGTDIIEEQDVLDDRDLSYTHAEISTLNGLQDGESNSPPSGTATSSSLGANLSPTPRLTLQAIKELVQQGRSDMCSTEELASFVNDIATEVSIKAQPIQDIQINYTKLNKQFVRIKEDMDAKSNATMQFLDKHCMDKVGESTVAIATNYSNITAELGNLKSDYESIKNDIDAKLEYLKTVGTLVSDTKSTIDDYVDSAKHKFKNIATEQWDDIGAKVIQAGFEQAANKPNNPIDKYIAEQTERALGQLMEKEKPNVNAYLSLTLEASLYDKVSAKLLANHPSTQELTNTIKALEERISHLETQPSRSSTADYTTATQPPAPAQQSREDQLGPDSDFTPRIPRYSLVDYSHGLMTMNNVRIIHSEVGQDGVWIYTGLTPSNTLLNQLLAAKMSNIRAPQLGELSGNPSPSPMQSRNYDRPSTPNNHGRSGYRPSTPVIHEDLLSQSNDSTSSIMAFAQYQYRYPKSSSTISKVHYSYITDKGHKWKIQLPDKMSIKPWYEQLLARFQECGILLRAWTEIEKGETLAEITAENCDNFTHAFDAMSRSIYNYLDTNKTEMFQSYTLPLGYIEGYRSTTNGFQVIYDTIAAVHPKLIDPVEDDENMEKPELGSFSNIYTFCNALKDHYAYVYSGVDQRPKDHDRRVLKYIKSQLTPEYQKASDFIQEKLKLIYADPDKPKPFPSELTLDGNVAITLMKQLPKSTQIELTASVHGQTVINKAQLRGGRRQRDSSPQPRRQSTRRSQETKKPPSRAAIDAICKACGTSGHCISINGCDNMARLLLLEEYKAKAKNNKSLQKAVNSFNNNQKERHSTRQFDKEIKQFRHEIRTFADANPNSNKDEIKMLYLQAFRDQCDSEATIDIFDDVFTTAAEPKTIHKITVEDVDSDSDDDDDDDASEVHV